MVFPAVIPAAPEGTRPTVPQWLERWHQSLEPRRLHTVIPSPASTAVFAVEMVDSVCRFGPKSSARLGALAQPVATLFAQAHVHGVRDFVLLQDARNPAEHEYSAYPRRNREGLYALDTIRELRTLPFADTFTIIPKHSLHPAVGTGLTRWLAEHSKIDTIVVVGAETDLAVYQTAMHLRMRANALNLSNYRVIVPANAVQTHHLSVLLARAEGALPHVGEFFQQTFLYHLALNGIEVVQRLVAEDESA